MGFLEFAQKIRQTVADQLGPDYAGLEIVFKPDSRTRDDPQKRRPDISLAKKVLGWHPKVSLEEGVRKTLDHFKSDLETKSLSDFYRHSHRIFD